MPAFRPHLILLNASLAGDAGNTAVLLARAHRLLARRATVESITLAAPPVSASNSQLSALSSQPPTPISQPSSPVSPLSALNPQLRAALQRAHGLLLGTGTHWDSWSSVLQKFLEDATATEATKLWLGKPAAVVVSEHSTGGKGVLSRLQGVLVTLGCSIPPLSGLVLSRAALLAARHAPDATAVHDFWCEDDLRVVCHNLAEAARITLPAAQPAQPRWRKWPVDRRDFAARWI
jgi:NAD(P)H-dependent FMN reductase